jgi:hypothetical protein
MKLIYHRINTLKIVSEHTKASNQISLSVITGVGVDGELCPEFCY